MAKGMPSKPKPSKPTAPKGAKHKPAGAGTRGRRIRPPRLYLYFDAVVRHGSIRRAAEALRIASSALNRRVLDLEEEIGTILFDRLQGGVRLTAAGETFAAHGPRTLRHLERPPAHIHAPQGPLAG